MKGIYFIALLSVFTLNGLAVDFSSMSMGEMQALRGNVAKENRTAFQTEMQNRVQAMTQEERQAFQVNMKQKRVESEDPISAPMQTRLQMQLQSQHELQTPLKTRLTNTPVR